MVKKKRLTSAKSARKGHFSNSTDSRVFSNVCLPPVVEGLLKGNLVFFICFMLESEEMSGHLVMKQMAQRFSSFVSQGTMYPLLDDLANVKILLKEKGKGRENLFSLNPDVREYFQEIKMHFLDEIGGVSDEVRSSIILQQMDKAQMKILEFSSEKQE